MPEDRDRAREQYRKTRAAFDELNPQDKAAFVLEATFSTVGRALEETGRRLADVLEEAAVDFEDAFRRSRRPYPEQEPEPAAPPEAGPKRKKKSRPKSDPDEG